jgi:hypothetical protein
MMWLKGDPSLQNLNQWFSACKAASICMVVPRVAWEQMTVMLTHLAQLPEAQILFSSGVLLLLSGE